MNLGDKLPEVVSQAGFVGTTKEILTNFSANLSEVYSNLLHPDETLTREQYELKVRFMFGYPYTVMFGTNEVTPSMKQIVTYMPFYIEKAVEDGRLVGLPLSMKNFSDGLMETVHKRAKRGNFVYSGGRGGAIGRKEYQEQVIRQIFYNEVSDLLSETSQIQQKKSQEISKKIKVEVIYCVHIFQTKITALVI